ncbi:hypothetical protein [Azospirillum melinis]
MGSARFGDNPPLPPGERVGVRGTRGVIFGEILWCIPLTLTLSPEGRGDETLPRHRKPRS